LKLVLVDPRQVSMKRQKRFRSQIFSHLAFPRDAEGESKHSLNVLPVQLLECCH